ncbi:hypothetical protein MMC07_004527 [Pseudocyphellaria aurata]|nr:hypothetical protein [Pseudocyphellaria aurata]
MVFNEAIMDDKHGDDDSDDEETLETINNLGVLYKDQGKMKEAEDDIWYADCSERVGTPGPPGTPSGPSGRPPGRPPGQPPGRPPGQPPRQPHSTDRHYSTRPHHY